MKKLTKDKYSSLLQKSVTYGQKSFITLGPGGIMGPRYVLWVLFTENSQIGE